MKIHYNEQTKNQFLKNLGKVFKLNEKVKVDISDIEVLRHPANPNFYGVTLKIEYSSGSYHDEGYFFQLWDFMNENAPQIQVSTWQPAIIGGKRIPKEEIFTLFDFNI